jgi:hypothetical protein
MNSSKSLLDKIEAVRRKNNVLWCNIRRVAYKRAPKQTKALLREIDANDNQISKLLRRLSHAD